MKRLLFVFTVSCLAVFASASEASLFRFELLGMMVRPHRAVYTSTVPKRFVCMQNLRKPKEPEIELMTDALVFKHLMQKDYLRNSFLSAVTGEEILKSEHLDHSLNPVRLINSPDNLVYHQLVAAIPEEEQATRLDLVCKTHYGLINVAVQVHQQNIEPIRQLELYNNTYLYYYQKGDQQRTSQMRDDILRYYDHHTYRSRLGDVSILDYVYRLSNRQSRLFSRQFTKEIKWEETENDVLASETIRKAIGLIIYVNPPAIHPHDHVREIIPGFNMSPWEKGELRRHFVLDNQKYPEVIKEGIEFIEINLAARYHAKAKLLKEERDEYRDWLELLAHGHLKSNSLLVKEKVSEIVIEAYREILLNLLQDLWVKAIPFYQKDADQGDAAAQTTLGKCYYHGYGVSKNFDKAVDLFQKATTQEYVRALYNLGFCYYHGHGVPKDSGKAESLFLRYRSAHSGRFSHEPPWVELEGIDWALRRIYYFPPH